MANTIYSGSPYFVQDNVTNLASATLNVYIYTGTQTTNRPATPTYTLFSTAVNEEVVFEIGQLINDRVSSTLDGTYRTDGIWVDYQIVRTLNDDSQTTQTMVQEFATEGYTYFEEEANYKTTPSHLLSTDFLRVMEGEDFKLPINRNYGASEVILNRSGSSDVTTTISSTTASGQVIQYVNIPYATDNVSVQIMGAAGLPYSHDNSIFTDDNVTAAVAAAYLTDNGFSNAGMAAALAAPFDSPSTMLETNITTYVGFASNYGMPSDYFTWLGTGGVELKKLNISYEDECKFSPIKVTFINRFGVMEDIWFMKRSDLSSNVESKEYQNNQILSGGSYNVREHQYKKYNVTSKESLTINSGFIKEEFNESFRQLLQSSQVWISYNGNDFTPVNIKSKDLGFKTRLNDKLINYTLELDFAFNKMNTVR